MDNTRAAVRQALADVRVIDPHCHLRAWKPSADSLADIVLYHHTWIEMVSSGMPQYEVTTAGLPHEVADPGMPPLERVRRSLKYLPNIRSTISGLCLRWILHDLYSLPELNEANLEAAFAAVQARAGDPAWQEEVLRQRCGIETSITVEPAGTPYSPAMLRGYQVQPLNIADGKLSPHEVLAAWEADYGREIRDAADYRAFLAMTVAGLPIAGYRFIGLSTLPSLTHELAAEEEITGIIGTARARRPLSPAQSGSLACFGVRCVLDELRKTDLRVIQWLVGAEVLLPHRSIPNWDARFTGALARIAGDYADFAFNVTTASDAYTQDLAIVAKHVPNVSVGGYWWHTLYPHYIRKSLETRLDAVPLNKIIGFFSDAYHCEWCYPKLKLVKQILEEILVERVERGWYSLDLALEIVEKLFCDNVRAIYRL